MLYYSTRADLGQISIPDMSLLNISMFIPFDHLYNWLYDLLPEPAVVYAFSPPGQKDITNLRLTRSCGELDRHLMPEVICHDQEPLNFLMYENLTPEQTLALPSFENHATNLRAALVSRSIYDKVVLIHSEKNSQDLEQYCENSYVGVHYWAHAVISKDWYRFAKHDLRLKQQNQKYSKLFLIYNRGWTGTREYRLKFSELLSDNNLLQHSTTSFFHEPYITPETYKFVNPGMQPKSFDFINHLVSNTVQSNASADYVPSDFNDTALSVVLETVFDDSRIHLTEKTLRPIACGHPFILAAGPGSLEYLKSYGFKTFSPWIDEDYDAETDSLTRLQKILKSMQNFANKPPQEQKHISDQLNNIAKFNQDWFFSKNFDNIVKQELIDNLSRAFHEINLTTGHQFLSTPNKNLFKKEKKFEKLKILKQNQLSGFTSMYK